MWLFLSYDVAVYVTIAHVSHRLRLTTDAVPSIHITSYESVTPRGMKTPTPSKSEREAVVKRVLLTGDT